MAILLLSSMAVLALFVLRRKRIGHEPATSPYRCPGYPLTPIVYLLVSGGVVVANALRDWQQSFYGVLIVGAGIPAYLLFRRTSRGRRQRQSGLA